MLIFVDESEWPHPKAPDGYTVWGAIALHPSNSRNFVREIFNLEKKFWKIKEPYQFEIKGRLLLSERAVTSPKKCEFCEEVISLCKLANIKAFAVGIRNTSGIPMAGLTEPIVYKAYSLLLERIEGMMVEEFNSDTAIIALDSADEATDTKRALAFSNYIYGTEPGRAAVHVMETPFFVSSKANVGIQIADLVAYALAQRNLSRPHLRDICDKIRELEWKSKRIDVEYPLHGFRFTDMQKPQAQTPEA
jgi:hypothetical protein